jgi:protein PhnA
MASPLLRNPRYPACPQCTLENTHTDGVNCVCADCGYEWPVSTAAAVDDHEIDCKTDAGPMLLQAAFLKKA